MTAKLQSLLLIMVLASSLVCCSPKEPVKIGFLGGVSGRVADLGIAGRNGALLAIEMRNKAGGLNGRTIELLVEDDQQDTTQAKAAVQRLIDQKVEAIVGPMTSMVAMATVPIVNQAQIVMMSPTVSTQDLSNIDDYFFRVISSTAEYAHKIADYQVIHQGISRVAVAYDQRNESYSESWLKSYQKAFEAQGGEVILIEPYYSGDEVNFATLAEHLLKVKPDAVLMIANSLDTAMLAQQVRKRDQRVPIATSEWAATERLSELGGNAVEGMMIAQFLDRESNNPNFLAFRQAYLDRFSMEPGFGGVTAFDATNVVLTALAGKDNSQTLKQAILSQGLFAGVQSEIRFDKTGDAKRDTYMTTIHNGHFLRVH
jgi:ABC-type branched-chain amino acid transport systems, periplasmic component